MTSDDIIRMAREAGISKPWDQEPVKWETLGHFAHLVAAAEREACAVIAETPIVGEQDDITMEAKDRIAFAIRERGAP